jgi:hypothetical protein
MKRPAATLFLLFLMVGATAWGETPVTVGDQFQINTYTNLAQIRPSLALRADGDFIVVWDGTGSSGTDTFDASIQGQRLDPAGTAVDGEFQVNTYTTDAQGPAFVGVAADDNFVVVWRSLGSSGTDTDLSSIQGQRFDAAGTGAGGQFQVNTYTTSHQYNLALAVGTDGSFVVVWDSDGSSDTDTDLSSIQGQRFDPAGVTVGGQFQINTYTTNGQGFPSVAVDADGDFIVVWSGRALSGTDTDSDSIQGQRYDATGAAVDGQFQINTYTTLGQVFPSVAAGADGSFVVVWQSNGSSGTDTSYTSIQGQRFDPAGTAVGGQFQVNTYTTFPQFVPKVALDIDGDFVAVWYSLGSSGTDTSLHSIQGQRFATPVFVEGMESGDLSGWSSTQ